MKLKECSPGPVLINGELYIFCDMLDHWWKEPHAHLIRCSDWQYVTFQNFADPPPGRTPARDIEVEPVDIRVVKGKRYGR